MKTAARSWARELRREQGSSVKEIARRLEVSPSSVSLWVRDVHLTEAQRDALRYRMRAGSDGNAARALAERLRAQDDGRSIARRGDLLHVAGCMLFWAEGSRARNSVVFVNSDPAMVAFFLRFLRSCFDVADERVRVVCNLFADHADRQHEIERFWLETLELPRSCLRKSTVNVHSKHSKRKRQNKLPYGTCRLVVHDTSVVQRIYGAIQEYAGFTREEWLM